MNPWSSPYSAYNWIGLHLHLDWPPIGDNNGIQLGLPLVLVVAWPLGWENTFRWLEHWWVHQLVKVSILGLSISQ